MPSACTPATTPGAAPLRFFFPRHLLCTGTHLGSRQAPVSPVRTTTTQSSCLFGTWAGPFVTRNTDVSRGTAGGRGRGRRSQCVCVRAGDTSRLFPPSPISRYHRTGAHARGMQRRWEGPGGGGGGEGGEVVHGKSCACVRPSVGTAGRGRGRCPGRPSRVGSRKKDLASLFSPGEIRSAEDWLCGGAVGGLPQSCRDPRLGRSVARCIGSWDSEPVAGNLGFREFAVYSARLF